MYWTTWKKVALILIAAVIFSGAVYQVPAVNNRLSWRLDFALTYLRGIINPVGKMPKPLPAPLVFVTEMAQTTSQPAHSQAATPGSTSTPALSPTPLPATVNLNAPEWEKQDINNCGPATLTMYLRYWGWKGAQIDIASLLKPQRDDRNVNVEELAYYVKTRVGWLDVQYRVGGNLQLLKSLLAAGVPMMIEESFFFEQPYWPHDDLWAAHYNLITGYDDAAGEFNTQDSFYGANQKISYQTLFGYWHVFNYVYLLVYPPDLQSKVQSILGDNWDVATNRQNALQLAQEEAKTNPNDAYAWFNEGSNLVYFGRYPEAAQAYDQARQIGLPQRMLRYQFGPFFAYFHTGRIADLMALTKYALQRTPNSEETLLWHGWGLYRQGNVQEAIADFQAALQQNPNYEDAQYALSFVTNNP